MQISINLIDIDSYRFLETNIRIKINISSIYLMAANTSIHISDVTMGAIAFQITSLTIVYSTVYSNADERKHQSSASLAFLRGIHRWSVNSPHKWPVTRKMFPFDDVIMNPGWSSYRIFPITFSTSRILQEDLEVGGYMVPSGVSTSVCHFDG